MPNNTTISTAVYRVQLAPHLDAWMRGDRYGAVQREYMVRKTGIRMVLVLMDKSNKLLRLPADAVTPLD